MRTASITTSGARHIMEAVESVLHQAGQIQNSMQVAKHKGV